ncbi:actin binding protein [Marasmius sp. AFHP31]|nr:actin binding protein [Marasmius sp. AFHP31]
MATSLSQELRTVVSLSESRHKRRRPLVARETTSQRSHKVCDNAWLWIQSSLADLDHPAREPEVDLSSGSLDVDKSPGSPSTQFQRTDTIALDRLEVGDFVARVASNSNTVEGNNGNEGLAGNADDVSRQIQTQNPTNSDDRNDNSGEPQARSPDIDTSSGSPNVDNVPGNNGDSDARGNDTTDLLPHKLPPEVEEFKRGLELALQCSAVSTALIASVSATVLQTYRSDNTDKDKPYRMFLDIISHGSLMCNIVATVSKPLLKEIREAHLDVLNSHESGGTDRAIFTYEGGTNDLKVQGKGDGGLEELEREFNDGRIQYAFLKAVDPNRIPKFAQINQCGDGVSEAERDEEGVVSYPLACDG